MNKKLKIVLLALAGIFVVIQFFRIDKSAPAVDRSQDFLTVMAAPAETATLLRDACYDCHSYETKYPWYSNIAPVSWWVKKHIDEGREHLNFSVYNTYDPEDKGEILEECIETVKEGEMPLKSYTWVHAEARLTQGQRQQLTAWFQALGGGERIGESEGESEGERE